VSSWGALCPQKKMCAQGVEDNILRLCSFDNLSNLEVNKRGKVLAGMENNAYFRRGEVGDWMNHLTAEMIEKLDWVKILGIYIPVAS
jgi:hypothetical protein